MNSGFAWFMLLIIFIASMCGPMTQFKVAAVEHTLLEVFNMDLGTYGLLMTFFAILGLVLALPSLFLVRKWGLKATILLAIACLGIGNILGVFVPHNATGLVLLLITRCIEGIGMALVSVAGPSAVGVWFTPEKRGFPLGCWAIWAPVGMLISFIAGPRLAAADSNFLGGDWMALWWLSFIICVIAFILTMVCFKLPEGVNEDDVNITASVKDCFKVLKSRNIWLLGIAFFCFIAIGLGVITSHYGQFILLHHYPVWGDGVLLANALPGPPNDALVGMYMPTVMNWILLFIAFTLVIQPTIGFLSDRVGVRKPFLIASFILLVVGMVFAFMTGNIIWVALAIVLTGLGGAVEGGAVRPMAPLLMENSALGITMGMVVLAFFHNLGMVVGPPIFGALVENFGGALDPGAWQMANYVFCLPVLAVGLILSFVIRERSTKALREEIAEKQLEE